MDHFDICSLPKVKFALTYSTDQYYNKMPSEIGFLEVSYIAEGNMLIERENGVFTAQKGDVLCNFYDTEQLCHAQGLHAHHTVGAYVEWKKGDPAGKGLILPRITHVDKNAQPLHRMIDEMINEVYSYKSNPILGASKFLSLLCAISDYNQRSSPAARSSDFLYTQRAKEYVNQNIHAPISLKEVAHSLSISPEYLCAVFKKTQGVSLIKYANLIKLENVRHFVEKEHLHLYEAAALFGFSDPNYASRLYKKYFGVSLTKSQKNDLLS